MLVRLILQQCRIVFGNVAIITYYFYKDRIAQVRHSPNVSMHRDKKNHKKKGQKRTTSTTGARKEEEPVDQDHLGQEGSHLNETG